MHVLVPSGSILICRVQRHRNTTVVPATTRSSTRELSNSVNDRPLTSATAQIAVKILQGHVTTVVLSLERAFDLDTCRNCLSPSKDGDLSIDCRKVYFRPLLIDLLARGGLRSYRPEARTKAKCGRLPCLPTTPSQPGRSH